MDGISRKNIYSFIAGLLTGITKNIYRISVPETLSEDAIKNGFIVLRMNEIDDNSEFTLNTYATVRMFIDAYSPSLSISNLGGIMNTSKFDAMQAAIDNVLKLEAAKKDQQYSINRNEALSIDDFYSNGTNSFYLYITSFTITI